MAYIILQENIHSADGGGMRGGGGGVIQLVDYPVVQGVEPMLF